MKPELAARELPSHTVRISKRARHVHLKVTSSKGLEVIVPVATDRACIPEILHANRDWIARELQRAEEHRRRLSEPDRDALPDRINLHALEEAWRVHYMPFLARHRKPIERAGHELVINCTPSDFASGYRLLQGWLRDRARQFLVPWLDRVAREVGLEHARASVRAQKTRWASCSSQRVINLNYKLLFLTPELVRYVFVHELCHTVQLNHSPQFWAVVASKEPGYRRLEAKLKEAARRMPTWVDR